MRTSLFRYMHWRFPDSGHPSLLARSSTHGATLMLLATFMAVIFAAQSWTSASQPIVFSVSSFSDTLAFSNGKQVPFAAVLRTELSRWAAWALVAPFVVVLVRHFPIGRQQLLRNAIVLSIGAVPAVALRTFVALCLGTILHGRAPLALGEGLAAALRGRFALDVFIYLAIVAAAHVVTLALEARRRDRREAQLAIQLVTSQLSALESQLHPQFFFDTLHTISALLDRDRATARRLLARFGELMRMLLESNGRSTTPLTWEFSFLSCYADIQGARFGNRVRFEFAPGDSGVALVPRLLLQPLVDSAVRRGVANAHRDILVHVDAKRMGDQIALSVTDTVGGPTEEEGLRSTAVTNLRERFRAMYGGTASLTVEPAAGGGVKTTVVLPYQIQDTTTTCDC